MIGSLSQEKVCGDWTWELYRRQRWRRLGSVSLWVLMIMMHVVGLVSGYTAELQGLYRSMLKMTRIGCEYGERMAK